MKLRPQCNTTKAKSHNSKRDTEEEQNYKIWIQKIQEQIDTESDKRKIKERHNPRNI